MWGYLKYMVPVATILSQVNVSDDVTLNGDLHQELNRLLCKYIPPTSFVLLPNPSLSVRINMTFPAGTSLWSVLDIVLQRFRLQPDIGATRDGAVTLRLEEGPAWKR